MKVSFCSQQSLSFYFEKFHAVGYMESSYRSCDRAATMEIIKALPKGLKIVVLSADFRLRDIDEYEKWYGQPHRTPDLQREAVYSLTQIYRREIQDARLVANPGCYPTSI